MIIQYFCKLCRVLRKCVIKEDDNAIRIICKKCGEEVVLSKKDYEYALGGKK